MNFCGELEAGMKSVINYTETGFNDNEIYSAKIKSTHRTFLSRYLELPKILTISSICNKESFFADML